VTINDVLPLTAARRDTSANLESFGFGASEHHDGFIYIRYMQRHLIRLAAGTVMIASFLRRVGKNSCESCPVFRHRPMA